METCIKERRSVRKFADKEITKDVLNEIVDIARFAPSWKNTQIARYYVIQDEKLKQEIAENCMLGFEFNAKTSIRANALVVVTYVKGVSGFEDDGSFSTPLADKWQTFDAGIATQTFCLAAHSKGIGSVVLGIFDDAKVHEYIKLPENQSVAAMIALGYPLEATKAAPPRLAVEDIVTYL